MTIITWVKYKKDNNINPSTHIIKSVEYGFIKLPLGMKKSNDDRKPKDIVAESVEGQEFNLVIYHYNNTPFQKGGSISIYAKETSNIN